MAGIKNRNRWLAGVATLALVPIPAWAQVRQAPADVAGATTAPTSTPIKINPRDVINTVDALLNPKPKATPTPTPTPTAQPTPTSSPKPTSSPTTKPGNPGDTKNCSDFKTQKEAQAWFDEYFPHWGDVAKLDSDGDGIACETLR